MAKTKVGNHGKNFGKQAVDEISTSTPEQKSGHTGCVFAKQANLSDLAGRAEHLHGLAGAAQLIQSE